MKVFVLIFFVACSDFIRIVTTLENPCDTHINLVINARRRQIEIVWKNLNIERKLLILTNEVTPQNIHNDTHPLTFDVNEMHGNNITDNTNNDTSTQGVSHVSTTTTEAPTTVAHLFTLPLKPETISGKFTTNIVYDIKLVTESTNVSTKCLGYWLYYVEADTGKILETNCLKLRATWMADMREEIKNFKLRDLFIPGSHDSSSYKENFDLKRDNTIVTKYSLTQDENVFNQLMYGIRYIDIRVGFYRKNNEFWANHGIAKQHLLVDILRQIKQFAVQTNEIIIIDFQEFPVGFRHYEIHGMLVKLIQETIGELMVSPSLTWNCRLDDIWKSKRNIIVGYDYVSVVNDFNNLLWQSVKQRWGDSQTIEDLKDFLIEQSDKHFSLRPVADMAELTPNYFDIITDRYRGLRNMADQINYQVTNWYSNELAATANVVAVDFFLSTNIIDVAICQNYIRSRGPAYL